MRALLIAVVLAVVAAACGGGSGPVTTDAHEDPEPPSPSAAIYAASMRQMVVDDNTFGGGGNPFTELLLLSSLDPGAGLAEGGSDQEIRPLTDEERVAIETALTPLAPVRWIDDADEWRTDDLMPVVEGSAILGVGPITFDGEDALVPMSMWCGGLCGTWFTYRVVLGDGVWVVDGIEGPIAVS